MKVVMLTNKLSRRFGDAKALELIKNAGFDGYDYSMFDNVNKNIFEKECKYRYVKGIWSI